MDKEPSNLMFEDGKGNYTIVRPDPYVKGDLMFERGYPNRRASYISLSPVETQQLADYLNARITYDLGQESGEVPE